MSVLNNKKLKLSIIIAAWNDALLLCECLLSLENQVSGTNIEVIVVSNFNEGIDETEKRFPFAKYIINTSDTTVPKLFAGGINECSGAIIALSEDFCTFDANWCFEINKAHELKTFSIIGGAIENKSKNALAYAVYFFDYGKYMLPNQMRIFDKLSIINISYKRELLDNLQESYSDGFFEVFINDELKNSGYKLRFNPKAIVFHNKTYKLGKITKQFYHQARSFAARRAIAFSQTKRLLFTVGSLFLPFLLFKRLSLRVIRKNRLYKELMASSFFLLALICVWSLGEFFGYLRGAGKSDEKWK